MPKLTDQTYLLTEQYRDGSNLNARISLHARFSTNPYGWFLWVFDQFNLPSRCRMLELGCGIGDLWLNNLHRIPKSWDITLSDFSAGMVYQACKNLHDHSQYKFGIIDAQAIPFDDKSLDAVIANHMLFHVPNRPQALSEIRRVLKPAGRLYATTAGEKHLHELPELVGKFDPKLTEELRWPIEFNLENGVAQLTQWFSHVTVRRYEDSLRVTQAAPLVDYVLSSTRLELNVDRRDEFEEFIEQELTNNGVIHITKDSGILEAF